MPRARIAVLVCLVPAVALGAGAAGFAQRVPTLPATVDEALAGLPRLETQAQALQRDIDAARAAVQKRMDEAGAAAEARAARQARNFEAFMGMSAAEMEDAEDEELEARMLDQMGMTMADMEALENMSDAEANAYLAGRQPKTDGLQKFAAGAPKPSDDPKLERLTREYGDWLPRHSARAVSTSNDFTALKQRWAREHAELDARLDEQLRPRLRAVPRVDCGEAGIEPDAIQSHAISLERYLAHEKLAPEQLKQGVAFLSRQRAIVAEEVDFADRFAKEAAGFPEMAAQGTAVESAALQEVSELLRMTLDINRDVVRWTENRAGHERSRPKSSCG